ncbi:unnamed protein product [Mytilus coruscus]|uniref:Uncharacterized protein n=1 Tax=Mytilus coruscus TaxID=42192 RepID=A0A6J8D6B3_MYTCO|nr:unnamed protein product [Mytilus coruscus]
MSVVNPDFIPPLDAVLPRAGTPCENEEVLNRINMKREQAKKSWKNEAITSKAVKLSDRNSPEVKFFLMHGRDPILPVESSMCPPTITYTSSDDYKSEMVTRLQEAFILAKYNLQAAQQKQKEQYDLKSDVINYAIGDKIWVFNPKYKTRTINKTVT